MISSFEDCLGLGELKYLYSVEKACVWLVSVISIQIHLPNYAKGYS